MSNPNEGAVVFVCNRRHCDNPRHRLNFVDPDSLPPNHSFLREVHGEGQKPLHPARLLILGMLIGLAISTLLNWWLP